MSTEIAPGELRSAASVLRRIAVQLEATASEKSWFWNLINYTPLERLLRYARILDEMADEALPLRTPSPDLGISAALFKYPRTQILAFIRENWTREQILSAFDKPQNEK
jgi:hypothetical protein